mgnify:CR=1 FL=1
MSGRLGDVAPRHAACSVRDSAWYHRHSAPLPPGSSVVDAVSARPHTIDLGAQVPHAALRAYVMGARGADHEEDPTPEEIGQMARITAEALEAGAMGFATSRTVNHRSRDGQKIVQELGRVSMTVPVRCVGRSPMQAAH